MDKYKVVKTPEGIEPGFCTGCEFNDGLGDCTRPANVKNNYKCTNDDEYFIIIKNPLSILSKL